MRAFISYLFVVSLAGIIAGAVLMNWLVISLAVAFTFATMGLAFTRLRTDGRLDREIQAINKE